MELVNKYYSKVLVLLFLLLLTSCASTVMDQAAFESSEEEAKRVLDDTYVVEQQKKLREYRPDNVKLKTLPMKKVSSGKEKTNLKTSISAQSKSTKKASSPNYLSQTDTWKAQDLKSAEIWKQFSPKYLKTKEKHVLFASYTGINAATLSIEVKPEVRYQSRDVYHFQAKAQTAEFYRWIYSLNDVVDSLVDKEHFVSWKYSLIQKEKNKDIEDIQFYDRNLLTTFSNYKKTKNKKTEESKKENEIPFYGQDYFSSFFFIRGLPLKEKDHYIFPTTTKSDTWLMSIKVLGREKVEIGVGEFKAIKLELMTKYTGDLAKKGPIIIWLSDDENRMLLKVSADVKIGSVKLELAQYYQADKLLYGKK